MGIQIRYKIYNK